MTTKAEKARMSRLADMGCIVCRNLGFGASPAEMHHIRTGVGKGQRAGHDQTIPLCTPHHRTGGYGVAIHAGKKVWEEKFGTELELLEQANRELEGAPCE